MAAERAGNAAEALTSYREAIGADPSFALAHMNLGIALHAGGELSAAIAAHSEAIVLDPHSASAHYNLALAHLETGQAVQAEAQFREALRLAVEFPDAWVGLADALEALGRDEEALAALDTAIGQRQHYLGAQLNASMLLRKMGRVEAAEARLREINLAALYAFPDRHPELESVARQLVHVWPDFAVGWKALGTVLALQQRFGEAVPVLQKALAELPSDPEIHNTLGAAFQALGRPAEAESNLRRALKLKPDDCATHNSLGALLQEHGRASEAEEIYRRALELDPDYLVAHNNLGNALKDLRRFSEAEASYRRALELNPEFHQAHNNLGIVLQQIGRSSEAEASCRRAIEIEPGSHDAHYSLGVVLQGTGRSSEAESSFRRAVELNPANYLAHNNLGVVLQALGRSVEAEASYRSALHLKPDSHLAIGNLGVPLNSLGRVEEAQACFRRALALEPGFAEARSNLLFALNYTSALSRAELFYEHLGWASLHEAPVAGLRLDHTNTRDQHRRLRVGYVSPDFRRHSVAYFIEPLIARHDRTCFEVYCYSNVLTPDGMTRHLMALSDSSCSIVGLSDAQAAERIRADGIDILVDLAGHTSGGRLGLFALKPAPVQVSYLGYPNTTGLTAIDWRITDVHADPPGDGDEFHSEQLARLPRTFLCFEPPLEAPAIHPPPSIGNGCITFGSFNTLPKITPEVIGTWARLLHRVPRSRLLLKASGLGDEAGRGRILAEFAQHGIDGGRLTLLPKVGDFNAHLSRYNEIDIGLDPFPYNGATTTCEAVWMGVPVVTLAGDRHAGRVGASILANLGLDEFVASGMDEYLAIAVGLAADPARLRLLRETMRDRVVGSPLRDEIGFSREIENAYRQMWLRWCVEDSMTARRDPAPCGEAKP